MNKEEIIYGRNVVWETLMSNPDKISKIYIQFTIKEDAKIREILIKSKQMRISIGKASGNKISQICGSDKHQGVVAIISDVEFFDLNDILEAKREKPLFLLIVDNITDPHNVGAIIRTAESAGVDAVLIPKDNSAPINSTVHKTSAGALAHIKLCSIGNVSQTIQTLKKHNVWVVGTNEKATKSYTDFDFTMPIALVMGSEGDGIRDLVRKNCDELVSIPMFGKISSLNVSVSTGVLLYEVVRQRNKQ